ncbi:unnamed protein product [Bursaphelenchus xylophilus]|uniref:(pine wood nematode) hypothetical protein n=1 Tax=Bursaphelenchus xylophilus TaxID=6326 RepID=A0A1I7RP19_BURXY|nr:unnamed protein product [Bursaphelenchus xylophilus]CAG9124463.1 unnamed protein product [Bursaphelenchus xylophilus]
MGADSDGLGGNLRSILRSEGLCLLEAQNERLRQQNLRCANELKALASYAENTKQWRQSTLFSQSFSGTLPTWMESHSRTSDDSGLTSDDTSGDRQIHQFLNQPDVLRPTLMTQSTSAIVPVKRSPRKNPSKTSDSSATSTLTMTQGIQNSMNSQFHQSSSTESSPSSEHPEPVAQPRKARPIMGGQMIMMNKKKEMERDSLNSYDAEDDGDSDDEIFDEIVYDDNSPGESRTLKKDARYADYVNLADFCTVKDYTPEAETEPNRASLPYLYSDILRIQPDPPKHKPIVQWEQKLYRNAEKCLSVVESNCSPSPCSFSPLVPRDSQRISDLSSIRDQSPAKFSKNSFSGDLRLSKHHSSSSNPASIKQLTPPGRDSDSGLGRGSGNSANGLAPLAESPPEIPFGMARTHAPAVPADNDDYALPPDASTPVSRHASPYSNRVLTLPRCRETVVLSSVGSSPLHQPPTLRASLIPTHENMERAGYLTQMSDNRLRSLKRRYIVLKNNKLDFYRTVKEKMKNEPPSRTIQLSDVVAVNRVTSKTGTHGIQICIDNDKLKYHAENDKVTEEWFTTISQCLKQLTINELSQKATKVEAILSGWITKVKHGHQRKYFAALVGQKLLFFKKSDEKLPCSHIVLQGCAISEKSKGSSDEYSGSSDEQASSDLLPGTSNASRSSSSSQQQEKADYSICIEGSNADPVYLMLKNGEEKDKWLYYLKLAAKDPSMCGTSFEVLIQRLMLDSNPDSELWHDVLMTNPEEKPTDTLISIDEPRLKKKALENDMALYLFSSVLMRPIAMQYHVDLSQNILTTALENTPLIDELYAQLIRLTCSKLETTVQAWKLMAMAIPLYLPSKYSIFWLLRSHLQRFKIMDNENSKLADFCEQLIFKKQKAGDRREGPSKLEAISILTRDPSSTTLPFSVPIQLPSGDFQVIEFDGCTEIGQCLSSLCLKLGLRPALLSGYALYAQDLNDSDSYILLKNKQKLCDCLTAWEKQVKDMKCGRVTDDSCSIRLRLRLRHYWSNLIDEETPMEKILLCYRMAEEIVKGYVPMSNELAEEMTALYAQLCYGDIPPNPETPLNRSLERFYPAKMLEVVNMRSLKASVEQHWRELNGVGLVECVKMLLTVLRRWKFFGAFIKTAKMKMHKGDPILIALTDQGVHLLTEKQMDLIRTFPFHRLVNFGEYHGDFMISVSRILPPDAHPEETPRERLTFEMPKDSIEQLTTHLAEYIRCQTLVWKLSGRQI